MAYSDYGAFVYKNGLRRTDKEDAPTFATDEETFGRPIDEVGNGARIWVSLLQNKKTGKNISIHHGIMGDGNIRVACHKQGLPTIYEATEKGIIKIEYVNEDVDYFDYGIVKFEYKGYKFIFEEDKPYEATMIEPNGDKWICKYDYGYGAGFEGGESE